MSGWNRLAPLGCDGVKEIGGIIKGLAGSAVVAAFWFFITYFTYYNMLFEEMAGELVLRDDVRMIPFRRVVGNSFVGFVLLAVVMVCLGIYHRAIHYQGSRSIDLLRRLPDRWEGFRRCWAIPLLGLAAAVLLTLALLGGFWLFYDWMTPAASRW
jgi:hypothetical protein